MTVILVLLCLPLNLHAAAVGGTDDFLTAYSRKDYKTALKHAEIALTQAPDDINKKSLADAVVKLKQGQDMNPPAAR